MQDVTSVSLNPQKMLETTSFVSIRVYTGKAEIINSENVQKEVNAVLSKSQYTYYASGNSNDPKYKN